MAAAAVGRLAREGARARMAKQWRNHEEARAARQVSLPKLDFDRNGEV
jgi:hypothetical protein